MPDIRLQDYVAKIKELIRSVRLDEAIAHSQHILRHYPKHVETYSMLGEACLEKEMYREAIEFFQRTLGADPENLIARVGLGVIYDEQGAFPEAIWQLERAFELVPGNSEVRRELLRLYGQYDGIDKTRLKLTRGALGRLYSRNGLYERAIGEFHAVLRQDPELPDVRVALVEALWREGRQLEAVEMCMELLDALPNCLKANLILGDIWLRGGNEEAAEQRLRVARALDPENRVAQELMGSDSPLPPEEVLIPELDAIPDEFGIALSGVPDVTSLVAAEAAEMAAAESLDEEGQEPWGTDEELPEWLRDVGVTAEEPALELAPDEVDLEPTPEEVFAADDMPEWLQEVMGEEGIRPAGEPVLAEGEAFEDEYIVEEETPEPQQELESPELAQAGLAAGAAVAAGLMVAGMRDDDSEESAGDEDHVDEMPEWLEELVGEAAPPSAEEPLLEVEEVEDLSAPLAAEVGDDTSVLEEESPPADELPDWLDELGAAAVVGGAALVLAEDEEEAVPADDALDLQGEPDTAIIVEDIGAPPLVDGEPSVSEEEILADDEIPDWMRDLGVTEIEEQVPPAGEAPLEGEVPERILDLDADEVEEVAEVETEDLSGLPVEDAPDAIPDWLRDLDAIDVEEVAGAPFAEVETEDLSELPITGAEEIATPQVMEAEEAPIVAEEIPLIDEIPDWLRDLDKVEEDAAAPAAVAEDVGRRAVPASLLALVAAGLLDESDLESAMAEMSDEDLDVQRAEAVPEWLSDLVEDEVTPGAEAVLATIEPEVKPEPLVEEAVLEAFEAEPEAEALPFVEETVLEAFEAEPEAEPLVEEVVLEAVEPEPEAELFLEEAVLEAVEAEPEAEPLVEETVIQEVELEPEAELFLEESVLEAVEPEPEVEPLVEEAVLEAVGPEPEAELFLEEAMLEDAEEEFAAPPREDELLQQLKTRPRDYGARLELARLYYGEQDWDAALVNYEKLISARRFLPDIVDDLKSLAEQDVEPSRVYHMLGDAYMQQDQLDEALEMYRLARRSLAKR